MALSVLLLLGLLDAVMSVLRNPWVGGIGIIVVGLLGYVIWRLFIPRNLSLANGRITWKRALQSGVRIPVASISAIEYVSTAPPWSSRFYFVDQHGIGMLWVDRFTPAQMAAFAGQLDVPFRLVEEPPRVYVQAAQTQRRSETLGHRRGAAIMLSICAGVGLLVVFNIGQQIASSRSKLEAYGNAPVCQGPARANRPALLPG